MPIHGITTISTQLVYASDGKLSRVFVDGVQCIPKVPQPLPLPLWEALTAAERTLYHRDGANGYTDVMLNNGDEALLAMWDMASISGEMIDASVAEVAARVAAAIAVLNYGKEFLLR